MILNDKQIRELCLMSEEPMINPYRPGQVRQVDTRRTISYGTSSFGYDVTLAEDVRIFSNLNATVINPKKLDERTLLQADILEDDDGGRYVLLPPNSYMLGHTPEVFNVPRDIMVIAMGKSTYARAGLIVNVTPIEPGFEGQVVIEVANTSSLPVMVYVNEGIAQFLFFRGEDCQTSYGDRGGKYQGQRGITLPRV